jgi:AmmeMemoRadiSam system protein A
MAPGKPDEPARLTPSSRQQLLEVARRAISAGAQSLELRILEDELPPALRAPGACFVTLERHGLLHGCIGTLEPRRALAADVAANARAAAFFDPRATRLDPGDLGELEIEISVLSPLEPFFPTDEETLHAGLIPEVTGLVLGGLSDGRECRATFLPSVWRHLPDPRAFVAQLRRKAGLAESEPLSRLRFWRYTVESFSSAH